MGEVYDGERGRVMGEKTGEAFVWGKWEGYWLEKGGVKTGKRGRVMVVKGGGLWVGKGGGLRVGKGEGYGWEKREGYGG